MHYKPGTTYNISNPIAIDPTLEEVILIFVVTSCLLDKLWLSLWVVGTGVPTANCDYFHANAITGSQIFCSFLWGEFRTMATKVRLVLLTLQAVERKRPYFWPLHGRATPVHIKQNSVLVFASVNTHMRKICLCRCICVLACWITSEGYFPSKIYHDYSDCISLVYWPKLWDIVLTFQFFFEFFTPIVTGGFL